MYGDAAFMYGGTNATCGGSAEVEQPRMSRAVTHTHTSAANAHAHTRGCGVCSRGSSAGETALLASRSRGWVFK
eukprot:2463889-Rhodomonas_salina.1